MSNNIEIFNQVTDLVTLDKKQIAKITARLPEYKRGSAIIGHSTSQSSYSLQTMQMISDSPLSRMKQCLAQIDKKYKALQEAYYKIERKKLTVDNLSKKTDRHSRLTVQEYESQIESITVSMNTTLREIGMFQDMYDSIKKNNNIPDNWDEKDFEKQEIANMVRSSFRIAIQDLSASGRVSKAAVEYWEQLGIHPQLAESYTREYLTTTQLKINNKDKVTIRDMYKFLDDMALEFKDAHQDALSRIGLDELGSEGFMANGSTKPR
jgi:type I site-specific restriction endonuclease